MYSDGIPHLAAIVPFQINTAVIKERFNSGEFSQVHDLRHVLHVAFMSRELNAQMDLLPKVA
jgi:HD superfamily phosphodiesterase